MDALGSHIRQDFPMLQQVVHGYPYIYLDGAATELKPHCVIHAMAQFYTEHYATVHRSVYDFAAQATARYNEVRAQAQAFLHASQMEEIVFTKGTTEGINLVAASFGKACIRPGDEVIISEMEHHSNIVPWQLMCQERGAVLKAIPINDKGELLLEVYEEMLTNKTKLVSIAHVANSTGTINPLAEIVALAHLKGAKVCVDGAQGAARLPVDVQKWDVDFYACSGHKMYGPTGMGVLYGKYALLEEISPYQGGGDMIMQVDIDQSTYQKPPLKFEAGTPMIAEVMGLGEALRFIETIGRDRIAAWEHHLLEYATQRLLEIPGLQIIGTASEKAAIISFIMEGVHPLDVGTFLNMKGIAVRTGHLCAQPTLKHFHVPSLARVSFGMYNTVQDIDALLQALQDIALLVRR